jgi:serine/threonine protein phosphatase PrpC
MIPGAVQGKYILGAVTKVGDPRRKHEDRVFKGEIQRMGGDQFILGIVADGVGSADAGERGAQLAIDTVVRVLRDSQGDNVPRILEQAIERANTAVYEDNQKNDADGLTTLVVAAIYKDRCFIGNVGDSRVYWAQGGQKGKMLKLTRDHSYFNIYGGVDPNSEEGGVLVNAIGKKSDVYIDLGFYLKGDDGDVDQAQRLGMNGLPVKAGDAIMLCSDGLIKTDRMNARYATDAEIIDALRTEYEPDTAAIKMVSAALGRRPDDNVSAVTIQYLSDQVIKEITVNKQRDKTAKLIRQSVPVVGIFILLVIGFFSVNAVQKYTASLTPVVITVTPPPTLTAKNSISVFSQTGSIGNLWSPDGSSQDLGNGIFTISKDSRIEITQNGANINLADGSSLYMSADTVFIFTKIENGTELTLEQGSIMTKLGTGANSLLINTPGGYTAQVSGSIMGVQNSLDPSGIFVDCYEGHCTIVGGNIAPQSLEGKNRFLLYTEAGVTNSDQLQRCRFWNDAIGENVVSSLGIICLVDEPTETPRPPTPVNWFPTPTKHKGDNGDVGTPNP